MSHLLDVNLLLACAWSGHADHTRTNRWLNSTTAFATAPINGALAQLLHINWHPILP